MRALALESGRTDAEPICAVCDVPDFAVGVARADHRETVLVRGELDIATAPLLRAVLDAVSERHPQQVTIDMSAVTFLDAYALGSLLDSRRRLAAQQTLLVVRNPTSIVRRVLALTGCSRAFVQVPEPRHRSTTDVAYS